MPARMTSRPLVLLAFGCLVLALASALPVGAGAGVCQVTRSAPVCSVECVAGGVVGVSGWSTAAQAPSVGVALKCGPSDIAAYCQGSTDCAATGAASQGGHGDCILLAGSDATAEGVCKTEASGSVGPGGAQDCAPQPSHTYALASVTTVDDSTGVLGGATTLVASVDPTGTIQPTNGVSGGITDVMDSNVLGDCNGDGVPGDFDGDLDMGIGGGFFGSGTTWEALCHYGYNVHALAGVAANFFGLSVRGEVGVDDPHGPSPPVFDPVTGQELQGCQTDGTISDNPSGGPSPDGDCLVGFSDTWSACGAGVGGDDGYWVFVYDDADTGGDAALAGMGMLTADF